MGILNQEERTRILDKLTKLMQMQGEGATNESEIKIAGDMMQKDKPDRSTHGILVE
jgi:hypothetical protein